MTNNNDDALCPECRWPASSGHASPEGIPCSRTPGLRAQHDAGHPHLVGGEFQSDKYPTCPAGKVPLSTKDPGAQDLLWEYAQRRRRVDPEFGVDLETALKAKGYKPPEPFTKDNVRELALITRPCGVCGVPVEDVDDAAFKFPWRCSYCHFCERTSDNGDIKKRFNMMGQMLKGLMRLAARHNPKPVSPERAAEARAKMRAHPDPVAALGNIMAALEPEADEECVEAAGKAWDAWDAERDSYQKALRQMELGLHVAGLMEHIEALGLRALEKQTKEPS